jgi:hypothetical protein
MQVTRQGYLRLHTALFLICMRHGIQVANQPGER